MNQLKFEFQDSDAGNDDEDSPLRRRKKPKREVEPSSKKSKKKDPKKTKKELAEEKAEKERTAKARKKAGGLSQLLGQRRCATEANERIARSAAAEAATGNFQKSLKMLWHG